MKPMKSTNKYLLGAILTIVFIAFVSYKVVMHYNEHIDFISKEIRGAKILPHVKTLVIQTQTLATTTLIEDPNTPNNQIFQNKYKRLHTTIQRLDTIIGRSNFLETQELYKKIKHQLALAKKLFASKDKLHTYTLLNDIVEDELKLIIAIANDSNLILDPKLTTYYLMDSLVNTIPQLLESLSQTKALYFRMLSDPHAKTQLMQTLGKLSSRQENLHSTFEYIMQFNPTAATKLRSYYTPLEESITLFIKLVQKSKEGTHTIQKELFKKDKEILTALSDVYMVNTQLLIKLLIQRVEKYNFEKNAIIASALLFFGITIFLLFLLLKHKQTAQHNKFLAYHDQLTSLANKHAFDRDLHRFNPSSALLVDIKQFSLMNDLYGEQVGDLILKAFADILREINKNYHCNLYRIGSDQFMILNIERDSETCHKIAKNIFQYCNNNAITISTKEKEISILLKVRIAKIDIDTNDEDDKLLCKTRADIALNYAKKKHKDYVTYDKSLNLEAKIQHELETLEMVKNAILENRIVPVFQKIQKATGNTYESLVRIQDKDDPCKLISPALFLETVYNTPYYAQITKIMIKKSFDTFLHREENFSINFSFEDITNKSTVKYLTNMIDKYHMYNRVTIELLETEAMQNLTTVRHFIQKLKKFGVKIAIDDFGSGYSNFIYLAEIEPDFIKIDGSIIKNIDTDPKSFIIAKHINKFAKEIGCQTIAEFVHSHNVQEKLKELDVDGLQGYHIAEPMEQLPTPQKQIC